jgi:hypothetical protein
MEQYFSSWIKDPEFLDIYNSFNEVAGINFNIDNPWYARLYILRQLALQQSNKNKKFIECGVYAGQSMYFVSDLCSNEFIGVDSFEGVSEPGKFDTEYFNSVKLELDISYAKNILKDKNNIKLIKGWIPVIFDTMNKEEYSYVHIDVDLYSPTKYSIEYLWPQLIIGGVLICDDYGSEKTPGARKAMDEYFGKSKILELPTGQAVVFKNE